MSIQWFRVHHEMVMDPKFRTIARVCKRPIPEVISVWMHLLTCASSATERGRTHSFNCEDVASALDMESEHVAAIVEAMQGRILEGDGIKAWEKRQVAREDGAAERSKAWREARKAEKQAQPNDHERKQTQTERGRTPDTDTDKDKEIDTSTAKLPKCPYQQIVDAYHEVLPELPGVRVRSKKRDKVLSEFWGWIFKTPKNNGEPRATNLAEGLAWVREYMTVARGNDFIMGRTKRSAQYESWRCTIDYLCSPNGMRKVIEETEVSR